MRLMHSAQFRTLQGQKWFSGTKLRGYQMMSAIDRWMLIFFLLSPLGAYADDVDGNGWTTVLIPIAFSSGQTIPGAHGSLWTSQVWFHNGTRQDLQALRPAPNCMPLCSVAYPAGFFGTLTSIETNHNDGGALLHLYEGGTASTQELFFDVRLLELSQRAQPTGVEIPVVREEEFFDQEAVLLGVPVGEGLRTSLRVYDPSLTPNSSVNVELLAPNGEVLASTIISPGADPVVPPEKDLTFFGYYPGYAALHDLSSLFPQLQNEEHYHIRITPQTEGMRYWPLISVTDNESQHVLLITAQ